MRFILPVLFALLPLYAHAQLVVRDGKPTTEQSETSVTPPDDGTGPVEAVIHGTRYPASAITAIDEQGQVRTGDTLPLTPTNRSFVPEDSTAWPADTVPLFVASCAAMHRELDKPCQCVIQNVMRDIPHNEFLKLSKSGSVESDERYQRARRLCIGTVPQQP